MRHLLLPPRRPVLRQLPGRLEHLPGVDPQARVRQRAADRRSRRNSAAVVPDPHWKAHYPPFVDGPNPSIEHDLGAGRRHPDGHRPGLPARVAAPAGRRLQRARERRQGRDPAPRAVDHRPRREHRSGRRIHPRPQRDLHLPPELLAEVKSGLYGATHAGDALASTFGELPADRLRQDRPAEVPPGLHGLLRRVVGGLGGAGRPSARRRRDHPRWRPRRGLGRAATGAAETPPWPPLWMNATTTSDLPPCDAQPAHHASAQSGQSVVGTSAVPVLP